MNKLIGSHTITLIFFFLSFPLYPQYDLPKTIAEKDNYYDQIREISSKGVKKKISWNYNIVDGNVTSGEYKDLVIEYDTEGKIFEMRKLDMKGNIYSIVIFKYNVKKLPVLKTEFLPEGQMIRRTIYKYDMDDCVSEIIEYNEYEYIIGKTIYQKETDIQCVTETVYFSPDSISEVNRYCYSSMTDGDLISLKKYKYGTIHMYTRSIVRENKMIKEEVHYQPVGTVAFRLIYIYSHLGRNTEVIKEFPGDIKQTLYRYRYDDHGNLTGYIKYSDNGNVLEYYKYSYN